MRYSDPFPATLSAADFVKWLDKTTPHPDVDPAKLANESDRLGIAREAGERDLVDRLMAWKNRPEEDRG